MGNPQIPSNVDPNLLKRFSYFLPNFSDNNMIPDMVRGALQQRGQSQMAQALTPRMADQLVPQLGDLMRPRLGGVMQPQMGEFPASAPSTQPGTPGYLEQSAANEDPMRRAEAAKSLWPTAMGSLKFNTAGQPIAQTAVEAPSLDNPTYFPSAAQREANIRDRWASMASPTSSTAQINPTNPTRFAANIAALTPSSAYYKPPTPATLPQRFAGQPRI